MMRSMFSGVSGLKTHQLKMDVIGNNIANVNTVGFKSSRVTFKEIFAQTISGASAPDADTGRGGVNPTQIGLGVNLAAIDNIMTQGSAQRTDNTMDLMIDGDAFFIVSDGNGTYFTRMGAMYTDEVGNLALSGSDGLRVNGWYAGAEYEEVVVTDENGNTTTEQRPTGNYTINKGDVQPIQISGEYEYIQPSVTTAITYEGNLNPVTNPQVVTQISFYDSLGNKYHLDVTFTKLAKEEPEDKGTVWEVQFADEMYVEGDEKNPIEISWGTPPMTDNMMYVVFDEHGYMVNPNNASDYNVPSDKPFVNSFQLQFDRDTSSLDPDSVFNDVIDIDFSKLRQFGGGARSNPSSRTLDGSAAGELIRLSLGADGVVTGAYSNGETRPIAQIAVTTFDNPAGLEKAGSNLFVQTRNSGEFRAGEAYTIAQTGGTFIVGSLEMSNVDLSSEFTDMITTQRGFQANSRIITVSDEMLQELVNLKR